MVRGSACCGRYKQGTIRRSMQYNHVRSTTRTTAGAAPSSAVPAGDLLAILEPQPAIQLCTTDTAQQTALSIKHITDHAKTSRFRTTAELLSRALGVGVLVTILHVPVATSTSGCMAGSMTPSGRHRNILRHTVPVG